MKRQKRVWGGGCVLEVVGLGPAMNLNASRHIKERTPKGLTNKWCYNEGPAVDSRGKTNRKHQKGKEIEPKKRKGRTYKRDQRPREMHVRRKVADRPNSTKRMTCGHL